MPPFAFCVALWEALAGARPFAGATLAELALHVTTGRRSPYSAGHRVPAWVRRVLDRGLSLRPGSRYPSMEALLTALQADPTRRRRALAAGAAAALTLAAGFGAHQHHEAGQIGACEADGASIASVWNEDARVSLRGGLLATGVAYAPTSAERVLPYIDAYANEWKQARTEACLDTRVRGAWTEDLLDRAVWCLDERRMQLEALIAGLSRASATSVLNAVLAAAQLPRISPCRDEHRLAGSPPLPLDRQRVLTRSRGRATCHGARSPSIQSTGHHGPENTTEKDISVDPSAPGDVGNRQPSIAATVQRFTDSSCKVSRMIATFVTAPVAEAVTT